MTDRTRLPWPTRLAAALLAALALGCGAEASIRVQLRELDGDTPYASLAKLKVTLSVDGENARTEEASWDGRPLELEPIRREDGLQITVVGLRADGTIRSKGESFPDLPARGDSCCVAVCFCTLALFVAGDCDCGSNTCTESCTPP